jgi:hypothetical protein
MRTENQEPKRARKPYNDVIEILREMGFTNLPVRLYGIAALRFALAESHAEGIRLNREQIRNFNSRMLEGRS